MHLTKTDREAQLDRFYYLGVLRRNRNLRVYGILFICLVILIFGTAAAGDQCNTLVECRSQLAQTNSQLEAQNIKIEKLEISLTDTELELIEMGQRLNTALARVAVAERRLAEIDSSRVPQEEQADSTPSEPPLIQSAMSRNATEISTLLSGGADANTRASNGSTALQIAAQLKDHESITLLLEAGADVNAKSGSGGTALYASSQVGDVEMVGILLQNGAEVNSRIPTGETPLHIASHFGYVGVVKLLLQYGASIKEKRHDGITPLYAAVQREHADIVKLLLAEGANSNTTKINGTSALFIATQIGSIEMVSALVNAGANVNAARQSDSATAMHMAAHKGWEEIAAFLIENGADLTAKSRNRTPLGFAEWQGKRAVALLIRNAGGNL